ncbi:regulator of v-atpase in vacuolar membrane 1 [Fusarium longipes]|uniref:Regulator of v-atpase in vacuolar membrane 1 n=1 Tax=Fusarium longipes TaxID=694270 RepID=A0A395RTK2_9HYPO|nr:regulator of v-atpase in vacuolar membrane 1 [Fusarium longipes]
MSPAAQRAVSPSDDGRSSNASRAPSSQDPYYTNEVVAAQELLDSAPEPKPLPAAALFKAYDAILPTYGIDPDSDHHLSTFVFRVSGEQGDSSLLDKFQSILNRMGIVLEFGDNTTVSVRTSASVSPAASSTSRQSNISLQHKEDQQDHQQNGHVTAEMEASHPLSSSSPLPSPSPSPRLSYRHQDEQEFSETDEEDGAYEEMRKSVVSSAMNRWRSLVANRRAQSAQRIPSFPSIPEEASADVRNFEAYSSDERHTVTPQGNATSAEADRIESHSPTSMKEPTNIQTRSAATQSFMHRPLAVLNNAIRSTTSLIQGNVPQVMHDDEHSQHDDQVPQSPQEGPPNRAETVEEASSDASHNTQKVHSPTIVAQSGMVDRHEGTVVHRSAPQECPEDALPQQGAAEDNLLTPEQQGESEKEHSRLLKRASRAREIYLASKVFNHWADRTARRLERDAVARRHMIRFRYFRSWSQAPALREPTVDHMRIAVIVKKWQRVIEQDKSLEETTRNTARIHELGRIKHILDCWSCHRLKHLGSQMTASRSRSGAMSKWLSQASRDKALQHAIQTQSGLRLRVDAIHQWQDYTQREKRLSVTSRRIGEIQHSFTYLREWWDQAEIKRRAADHHQQTMVKNISFIFDQWNLRARAQAFQWRREYLQVGRVFDRWLQHAEQDGDMARRVEEYYEGQAKAKVIGNVRRLRYDSSQMTRLEDRARLYLGATAVLRVFDRTIRNRKDQDKQHIKRYLMARYTQVSSARKKRNCFSAVDRWKALAMEDRVAGDLARELLARKASHQMALAIDSWMEQADINQRQVQAARLLHAQEWLEAWKAYAIDLEQQDTEAWQLWAADQQRQCLKSWSIASLQQSGQAHTAFEVRKKHERERRNRALQHWKQRDDRIRTTAPRTHLYPNSVPTAWPRGGWRMTSGRRSITSRNDRGHDYSSTPLETPTRWTGQPFSMSTMMPPGSMAPLRETDEDDGAFSLAGDDDDAELPASPSLRPASRGPSQFSSLPSTTPMAPVPSHLDGGVRGQGNESDHSFAVRETLRRSRMPRFEASQTVPKTSMAGKNLESAGPTGRSRLSQQPLAARRSFGFKPLNGRSIGPQFSSPEPQLPAMGSKSVGSKPSNIQSAPTLQTAKFTPATRSYEGRLAGKPVLEAPRASLGLLGLPKHQCSAFTILEGCHGILQTVYDEGEETLEAIAFDEATGKIATCTLVQVRVYKPLGSREDTLKWALEATFDIPFPNPDDTPCTLSWGSSEELLVATRHLSLFDTKTEPRCLWQKELPSIAKHAILSYDSRYIASTGHHDHLIKVWRRLNFGADEVRFDLTYLRHPSIITSVRWRRPFHVEQASDNVLYTICVDKCIHVWTPADTPDGKHWQLWGQIDVCAPSQENPEGVDMRFALVLDGRDFTASVEQAVQARMSDDSNTDDPVALDHLVAVATKNPEICIAFDGKGIMSAWALENVSCTTASSPALFKVAQVTDIHFELLGKFLPTHDTPHTEIQTYCDKKSGKVHFMLHAFDGRIGVFSGSVADLFDPTTNDRRLSLQTIWSGHSTSITKIVRNYSGRAVVSRTRDGESIVWKHLLAPQDNSGLVLTRASVIPEKGHIHRIGVLRKGRFVIFLRHETISLWDCRTSQAALLAQCGHEVAGKPLCLIILPRSDVRNYTVAHIATITSEGQGIVWEIHLPRYFDDPKTIAGAGLRELSRFELKDIKNLAYVLPVDPAGSQPVVSGFLDIFARDVAISYTHTGRVDFWTARVDPEQCSVGWLSTCTTETGISQPALVSGSTLKKAALVNTSRSQLTIWDIGGARLEYENNFQEHQVIQDLDWTSTPDGQSILAVGFPYRVILLSQMRFDYLNKGPAWAQIREISIRELTPHPIGDSTWLGDGHLVIGAGNQMFVQDRYVGVSESMKTDLRLPLRKDGNLDLFQVVQRFNGPLPVFHPQFLIQCILSGKATLVRRILMALYKTLKYHIDGETLDDYLGMDITEFYVPGQSHTLASEKSNGIYLNGNQTDDINDEDVFTEQTAVSINEKLIKTNIPQLSGHEQIQLADIIECVSLVERHRRSMDENGARFMLLFRQHALRKGRTNEMHLSWREINWAFHSNSQDILVDFISRQNHGNMRWEHARESGLFMWLTDPTALKAQFELIARNEYTKNEVKNPVDCSLYYLALRKKTILQGLWRMANWNKEQAATQRLLANNFEDPKWRSAALKNAYALLSRRRFEYAAAFFLLADHLHDAVQVCLNQLKDMQLAITISRVYEGDDGPVLRRLLQDTVLPLAAQEGNRWLAAWAFWMLGRKDVAVRALITPVYTLLETPCSPDIKSRLYLTDDPALVVLYSHLRHQTLQTLRGASKITPKVEWEFVLHSAKLYDRMGCDLLGLDIVRNWEFQKSPGAPGLGGEVNPLKLLRRRSSLVVADLPSPTLHFESHRESKKTVNAPPTTFEEPDAGSLLDSFGF